jgi:two-component system sensor histidine kinase YesM
MTQILRITRVILKKGCKRVMKRLKSKVFTKNFMMFLVPILIPLLTIGSLAIIITYRFIGDDINKNTNNLLTNASESIEVLLGEVDSLYVNFGINPQVTVSLKRILNNTISTDRDVSQLDIIRSLMNGPAYSKPYIDSVYVYFNNENQRFISTSEGLVSVGSTYDPTWYNDYLDNYSERSPWIKLRNVKRYSFEANYKKLLTVYRTLYSYNSSESSGVIVLNIDLDYIEQLLDSLKTYPNQKIIILDESNNIICQSTGSSSLDKTEIKEILNQDNKFFFTLTSTKASVFSEILSEKYGLKYISIIPHQELYKIPIRLIKTTFVLILLTFFISLSLTYYFTGKNFKRIQEIVNVIESAASGQVLPSLPSQIKDEYNYIIYNVIKSFIEQNYLKVQLSERKYKLQTMELLALQAQINPHFLFNTLQTINLKTLGLTGKPNEVNTMIENLSDILKYSLTNPTETISLKEEIENVKSYITIQKIRYRDKFEVIFEYDEGLLQTKVPKLILQPLIENSLYHGIKEKEESSKIKIRIKRGIKNINIAVIDTGLGISRERLAGIRELLNSNKDFSENIGLYNTDKRLKLIYGEEYGIKILSKLGYGTCIYMEIP